MVASMIRRALRAGIQSQLADKIDDKKLRKELLQTAIEQLKNEGEDNIKRLKAILIAELAIIDN